MLNLSEEIKTIRRKMCKSQKELADIFGTKIIKAQEKSARNPHQTQGGLVD